MTAAQALDRRPSAPPARQVPGAPSVPQVNLLPPEIRASRSLARVKRALAFALVLVIALAAGGYVWSLQQVEAAQDELAAQEAETTRLLNAQREFSEVPQVLGQLERAQTARLIGSSTEILWAPYLRSLMAVTPAGVQYEEITYTGAGPNTDDPLSVNPLLQGDFTGTLSWVGRSPTVPDVASWIEGLESIANFSNAFVTSSEISERDENGTLVAYYEVVGSVQVSPAALAHRFVEVPEDADSADEEAGA